MVTITYALGAVRISGRGALVQRMPAVEGLSHVDVLCFDKTGTLTTNQLKLEAIQPLAVGEERLKRLLGAFAASSSARNRTTNAVLEAFPAEPAPLAAEVPFDSERKWSAVAFDDAELRGIYAFGAPEVLSAFLRDGAGVDDALEDWTARGLRVLLFAGDESASPASLNAAEGLPALEALGLIALRDELRQEAAETIDRFRETGIELKVLSGDNPDTVAALARQAGLHSATEAVAGPELDAADDEALTGLVAERTIFGRISPDHKERLIGALQRRGEFVAMIGDGVNDIPALKRANVSVSVRSGSPATRGVADIVLINDSFSALPPAFVEGQRIRGGMQTIIRLFLVRTLSVSLLILAAALIGDEFPTTPRLAGIPAFLTVGLPALLLAFLARPGKTADFLVPASAEFVVSAAITVALQTLCIYHGFLVATDDLQLARSAATISAVLCGLVVLPYARRPSQNDGLRDPDPQLVLISLAMLPALAATMVIEPLRDFYELVVPSLDGFAVIAASLAAWAVALHVLWKLRWSPPVPKSWGL
jgi:cation-transporting ATPase E